MICKSCGRQLADGAKFCDGCGAQLTAGGGQAPVQPPQTQNVDQDNKIIFMLAYLGILFFLPLVAAPNSQTGRYHANQGLVLLIASVVGQIVLSILTALMWQLWFITSMLSFVWALAIFALVIIGMVNAYKGEQKPLPVIGGIKIIK